MTSTKVLVILHSGAALRVGSAPCAASVACRDRSGASLRKGPRSAHAERFGGDGHGYPRYMKKSRTSAGAMVPGLVTIATSFVALVVGAVAMVAGYLTFGAVAMIVSLAAATFGAVWLLSGMLLGEHHHSHQRHA